MKNLLYLILFLVSNLLFSQNYHYTSYSNYFDIIGYDNILTHKISKIDIDIEDYQTITAYFNDKAQIEKLEIKDKSLNLITVETYFNWNSEFNYTLSSLSDYQTKEFTFMNKTTYNYIKKGDKKMRPVVVTQYWLYKDLFWYAEKYDLHNYSNTITRSLNGAIDFMYFKTNLLKSIKTRKVTSEEFSNERSIMYPKHHIQESKAEDFEYDTLNNLKKVKTYFRNSLTSVKDLTYQNNLLSNIVEKTNYNNSKTELTYSSKLVTKISLTSDLYPDPFISKINYYIGDEKINLIKKNERVNEIPNIEKNIRTIQVSLSSYCDDNISNKNENKDLICECFVENTSAEIINKQLESDYHFDLLFEEWLNKCKNRDYLNEPNMFFNFDLDKFYIAKVNLNVRSDANVNSDIVHVIKKGDSLTVKSSTIAKNMEIHEINGKKVKSYWFYIEAKHTETEIIGGWVFRGGLTQFFKVL